MRAVLLGPRNESPMSLKLLLRKIPLLASDLRIGVDGGTEDWLAIGRPPQMAIGDWDSLRSREVLKTIAHMTLPVKKDRSDLHHALALAREMGAVDIVALGVTGGRPDHHLASLLELGAASAFPEFRSVQAVDGNARYFWVSPSQILQLAVGRGGVFSVFALGGDARGVSISGARFSLSGAKLQPGSLGLSNVARSARVTIEVKSGGLLVVAPQPV